MLVIGLTGGIGSGKSTVAAIFATYGIAIIDADVIARDLTQPEQGALAKIVKHFGATILNEDGSLNRAALRKLIFSDTRQRKWLENLLHPLIFKRMQNEIDLATTPYVIAVIPLLLEVEFYGFINRVLVVDTPEHQQMQRIIARDHITELEVTAILNSQATREQRRIKAQDVIINDEGTDKLNIQVAALHQKYLEMAKKNSL